MAAVDADARVVGGQGDGAEAAGGVEYFRLLFKKLVNGLGGEFFGPFLDLWTAGGRRFWGGKTNAEVDD